MPADKQRRPGFPISLNTSTLRGHKLPITRTIEIARQAGYSGIEPWPDELDRFVQEGGTLSDLRKRLGDAGLNVTGAIAFFHWMVDDAGQRQEALEEAKHRMGQLAEIGGTVIAAPPAGDVESVRLLDAAERYHDLLVASEAFGVTPAVEVWGFAKKCSRLGEAALIAIEANHPKACILPDVFHLYKGGSSLGAVRHINGDLLAGFHVNDYPADPPRATIKDQDRVYPGDGVAPLKAFFRDLWHIGYRGAVSIELFNPAYYKQDPAVVAKAALAKTKAVMTAAFAEADASRRDPA